MDCWVASGIDERAVPARLKPVLDHVEKGALNPRYDIDMRRLPQPLGLSDTSVHYLKTG